MVAGTECLRRRIRRHGPSRRAAVLVDRHRRNVTAIVGMDRKRGGPGVAGGGRAPGAGGARLEVHREPPPLLFPPIRPDSGERTRIRNARTSPGVGDERNRGTVRRRHEQRTGGRRLRLLPGPVMERRPRQGRAAVRTGEHRPTAADSMGGPDGAAGAGGASNHDPVQSGRGKLRRPKSRHVRHRRRQHPPVRQMARQGAGGGRPSRHEDQGARPPSGHLRVRGATP